MTRVQKPKLIKKVTPVYPKIARKVGIKGRVIVEATTDIYGRVSIVKVINGHPLLNNAAIIAIKQWIYEPYIVNGIPPMMIKKGWIMLRRLSIELPGNILN